MIVNFEYNSMKDAEAWVYIAKSKDVFGMDYDYMTNHIPKELLKQIKEMDTKNAILLINGYLNSDKCSINERFIYKFEDSIRYIWNNHITTGIEQEYINRLEKITGKEFKFDKLTCYITTGVMCPYNFKEKWFTVSINSSIPNAITTIAHELLHFHTLSHYEIGEDLKEALTVILNLEFKDILWAKDKGYEKHKALRDEITEVWEKTKNFNKLTKLKVVEVVGVGALQWKEITQKK